MFFGMFSGRNKNEKRPAETDAPDDVAEVPGPTPDGARPRQLPRKPDAVAELLGFAPDEADPRQLPRKLAFTPEGRRLGYVEAGSGPPVILIPGMLVTLEDMVLGPFDTLARDHRVLAFDRPGYGKSDRRRLLDASPWAQARLIRDAVRGLGIERPILVGQSYGAAVALAWAMAYPGEAAGVVAISPISFPTLRMETLVFGPRAVLGVGDVFNLTVGRAIDPALLSMMWQYVFQPNGLPPRFRASFPFGLVGVRETTMSVAEDSAMQAAELWRSALAYPTCRTPVHVLAGGCDVLVNHLLHALPMTQLLPDARFTCLPGMGNMLHHFAIGEVAAAVAEVATRGEAAPKGRG